MGGSPARQFFLEVLAVLIADVLLQILFISEVGHCVCLGMGVGDGLRNGHLVAFLRPVALGGVTTCHFLGHSLHTLLP